LIISKLVIYDLNVFLGTDAGSNAISSSSIIDSAEEAEDD